MKFEISLLGNIWEVSYITDFISTEIIEDICSNREVALDVETCNKKFDGQEYGLDFILGTIRLLQLATKNKVYIFDFLYLDQIEINKLKQIFKEIKVIITHHGQFDTKFCWSSLLPIDDCGIIFDTELAIRLIENPVEKPDIGHYSLKESSNRYLNIEVDKSEQKSDWSVKQLSENQLRYAALDPIYTKLLYYKLKTILIELYLAVVSKIEFRALPAIASIEYHGIHLNLDIWNKLIPKYEATVKEYETNVLKTLDHVYVQKTFDDLSLYNINIDSPSQLLPKLQQLGLEAESVGKKVLGLLDKVKFPIIYDVIRYKEAKKKLTGFITTLPTHIHPSTNRIHPNYNILGTYTGRTSCNNPNLLNIPRQEEFREAFTGQYGNYIIDADYSSMEPKICAELANVRKLIQAFLEGKEPYVYVASRLYSTSYEHIFDLQQTDPKEYKNKRQNGKVSLLGLQYGQSALGLKDYAKSVFYVDLSTDEAYLLRDRFFEEFPEYLPYHQQMYRLAKKQGYLTSYSGRRINGIDQQKNCFTIAANCRVQAGNADAMKLALGNMFYELKAKGIHPTTNSSIKLIGSIYDECLLESEDSYKEEACSILERNLVDAAKQYVKIIPVEAEAFYGESWAKAKK